MFCAIDAPVKFSVLTIRNDSGRARRVSATGYVEWVLGSLRPATAPHIVTDHQDDGPATARNPYSGDHADYMGFFDVDPEHQLAGSMTCDRTEFIGRNGNLLEPMALRREGLSGRTGAALDPCAAFQVPVDLAEGETRTVIVFRLGMGKNHGDAERIAHKYRGDAVAQAEFERVTAHWTKTLAPCRCARPTPPLNALANGWLVYQTIACRLWARSGYYQSGGAFGFRDQLQDAMALVHARRSCCARSCCWPPAASSRKATCSTGGIRRRAVACARTSATTTCGCRWACAATSRRPATTPCSTSR